MQLAFRVDLDIESDPCMLQTLYGFRLGDAFVTRDSDVVHIVKGILTQYVPVVRFPAVGVQYLIADGLVIDAKYCVKEQE